MSRTDDSRRSLLPFVAKVMLIGLLVIVAGYLLLLADLQRALNKRLNDLRAAGVPTTYAEVAPPPVPDAENAAIVYQQALEKLNYSADDRETLSAFVKDDPPGSREKLLAQTRQILERNRAAIELARQAASMGRCRFPVNWSAEDPREIIFPHLRGMRSCDRLLSAEAVVQSEQGHSGPAVESCQLGLRIAAHVLVEPSGISVLTAVSVEAVTFEALAAVIERHDLPTDVCWALYQEIGETELRQAYRKVFVADVPTGVWAFDTANRDPQRIKEWLLGPPPLERNRFIELYLTPLGRIVRLKEQTAYVDLVEAIISAANRPYRKSVALNDEIEDRLHSLPPYYFLTFAAYPAYGQMQIARDRAIARRGALQIALVLEAYHGRHADYPDSLAALHEYPGWELPDDPFSGKEFVYRRQGKGFVLYSWGEDLDDDGGRPPQYPDRDGDLAWEFER